jgi:hypothetical protein
VIFSISQAPIAGGRRKTALDSIRRNPADHGKVSGDGIKAYPSDYVSMGIPRQPVLIELLIK